MRNFSLAYRFAILAALLLAGCRPAVQKPATSPEWDQFVNGYMEAYFAAHPAVAVGQGRDDFDGKLPDFTRAGFDKEIARLHAARTRALGFSAASLDSNQQFEQQYVLASIDSDLFWLESDRAPFRNPYYYDDPLEPQVYLTRPYAPLDQRMRAFVAYEHALPAALQQIRSNLKTPMPRTFVDLGHGTFGGLADYFTHDVPGIFASVKDAQLQSNFTASNAAAIQALKSIDAWIVSLKTTANDDFALGPDLFQKMLYDTER